MEFKSRISRIDQLIRDCFSNENPSDGDCNRSGVYLFLDAHEEILYVGKATRDNLGREIWGKFGKKEIVDRENYIPRFVDFKMLGCVQDPELRQQIVNGYLKIVAFVLEPAQISSLVEVFLQTYCQVVLQERLPVLNQQIG